jgi:DNA-binding PadR family transcriptional regulator
MTDSCLSAVVPSLDKYQTSEKTTHEIPLVSSAVLMEHNGLELTESTVYPPLARLAREGQLSVTSAPSPAGPPRRYYRITAKGKQSLNAPDAN